MKDARPAVEDAAERPRRAQRRGAGLAVVVVLGLLALGVTAAVGLVRTGIASSVQAVPVGTAAAPALSGAPIGSVWVHIAGAVVDPGLYAVAVGARVAEAVAAAGGFADDADATGVNLAREVVDGEQIVVPRVGDESQGSGDPRVDINHADVAELETLPGIGPALAQRIIAWREENGPFRAVDDLRAVSGIGDALVAGLTDLARV